MHLVALIAGAIFLAGVHLGCATSTLSEAHQPGPRIQRSPTTDLLLVGKPEEARPLGGRSRVGVGLLAIVPLVPYAHQQITPDTYLGNPAGLRHDFRGDLAAAITKDLRASGLFGAVALDQGLPIDVLPTAYSLRLTLDEAIWNRNITLYGLSFAGAAIWLLAPVSYGSVELAMTAELLDPSQASLCTASFGTTVPVREWVWVPYLVRRRFPEAFGEVASDLREFLSTCPKNT